MGRLVSRSVNQSVGRLGVITSGVRFVSQLVGQSFGRTVGWFSHCPSVGKTVSQLTSKSVKDSASRSVVGIRSSVG